MAKRKFYVVWHGVEPGIYESWADCQAQIKNFKGAVYKSFDTFEAAEEAYYSSPDLYVKQPAQSVAKQSNPTTLVAPPDNRHDTVLPLPASVVAEALAVDAACSGNPGPMEYRGVYLKTGQEVFHFGPVYGTNNIGEFLAIVHGLAPPTQATFHHILRQPKRHALGEKQKMQDRPAAQQQNRTSI